MIRLARLPDDRAAILSFIDGSQAYEAAFEANRRLDSTVAAQHLESLLDQIAKNNGLHLIAEQEGRSVGWAVAHVIEMARFVKSEDRNCGYISELYVAEDKRGLGIGRALIVTCENHFRSMGLPSVMIGSLAKNARAMAVYQGAGYTPYSVELRKYL